MRELEGGRWSGSFWSWIDDYASTNSVGHPTASYAWSSGLWKWIGASGKDGLCRLPTKTMVARMMTACMAQANANDGDPKGCRMPSYNPAFEPAPDAGGGSDDGGLDDDAGDASADGGSERRRRSRWWLIHLAKWLTRRRADPSRGPQLRFSFCSRSLHQSAAAHWLHYGRPNRAGAGPVDE